MAYSIDVSIVGNNYTGESTPKTSVVEPVHYFAEIVTMQEGADSHHFMLEATLTGYSGITYYPCIEVEYGENGSGGFSIQKGCGVFEDAIADIDGESFTGDLAFSRSNWSVNTFYVDSGSVQIVNTNMPVIINGYEGFFPDFDFTDLGEWGNYSPNGTHLTDIVIQKVMNFRELVPEDYEEYWTNVTKGNYTITASGKTLNGSNSYAWEKIKTRITDTGKIAWAISSDGKTATLVITKSVVEDIWSDSKGYQWTEVATPHFLSLPYEWDGLTLGTFDIAASFKYGVDTNIPIFDNRDIQGYLDGDKDITDSKGYSGINKTGEEETTTEFPDVEMSMYTVSTLIATNSTGLKSLNARISDIPNFIASLQGMVNSLEDAFTAYAASGGLIYGAIQSIVMKPMEMFNSVIYFPFDVSQICDLSRELSSATTGFFRISFDDILGHFYAIGRCNGSINLGSVIVSRTWFDYRDLTNMRCQLYLPYVGYVTLNLNEIIGKSVNVKYYVDMYTGGCVAVITANNRMIAYQQGIIGVNLAITPESSNGLFNMVGSLVSTAGNIAAKNYAGAIGSALGTANSLASTGSGSCPANGLGLHLPQYAFFVFESDNINETANEVALDGKPSDVSASIGSFSGFLKVKSVDLHCSGATDNEKEMIKSLLQTGVYI